MNDLDDLRSALEQHAHDVRPLDHATQQTHVKGRIMEIRRRRNAVRGGVALAAVAAIAAVVVPQLSSSDEAPMAGQTTWGDVAPKTKEALGMTYVFSEMAATDDSSVTLELPDEPSVASLTTPPLLTWTTSDTDAVVTVVARDGEETLWSSSTSEFDDHVVLDSWEGGPVEVRASEPGVAAALYDFDPTAPIAGVSAHGVTFRDPMQGSGIIAAEIGTPGQARVEVPYSVTSPTVTLVAHCSGVDQPKSPARGLTAVVRLDGDMIQGGKCSDERGAQHGGYATFDLAPHQLEGALSIELTRSLSDDRLVEDASEELVLGVALYEPMEFVTFHRMPDAKVQEYAGHLWEVRTVERRDGTWDVAVDVPAGGPWLASATWAASLDGTLDKKQVVTLSADDQPLVDPLDHLTLVDRGVTSKPRPVPVGTGTLTASSQGLDDLKGTQVLLWERIG